MSLSLSITPSVQRCWPCSANHTSERKVHRKSSNRWGERVIHKKPAASHSHSRNIKVQTWRETNVKANVSFAKFSQCVIQFVTQYQQSCGYFCGIFDAFHHNSVVHSRHRSRTFASFSLYPLFVFALSSLHVRFIIGSSAYFVDLVDLTWTSLVLLNLKDLLGLNFSLKIQSVLLRYLFGIFSEPSKPLLLHIEHNRLSIYKIGRFEHNQDKFCAVKVIDLEQFKDTFKVRFIERHLAILKLVSSKPKSIIPAYDVFQMPNRSRSVRSVRINRRPLQVWARAVAMDDSDDEYDLN